MATLTISLPDPMTEWIERRVKTSGYASVSAYLRDLVERERINDLGEWPEPPELTLEDLRRIIEEARASGASNRTMGDIIADGDRIAKERGFLRE